MADAKQNPTTEEVVRKVMGNSDKSDDKNYNIIIHNNLISDEVIADIKNGWQQFIKWIIRLIIGGAIVGTGVAGWLGNIMEQFPKK